MTRAPIGYNLTISKRTNQHADLYREKTTDEMSGVAIGMNHRTFNRI